MYEHSRESNLITSIILLSPWIQHSLSFIMVTSQTLTLLKKLHNKKWHLVPFNHWLARMVHAEKTLYRIYQVPYLTLQCIARTTHIPSSHSYSYKFQKPSSNKLYIQHSELSYTTELCTQSSTRLLWVSSPKKLTLKNNYTTLKK